MTGRPTVTLFCGYLDPTRDPWHPQLLQGRPSPPLLIQAGECTELPLPRGPLAGIIPQANYRSETVQLNRSDLLLAYTDGLSERGPPSDPLEGDQP